MSKYWNPKESHAFRAGAKRRRLLNPQNKVHTVMSEFKHRTLHSGSGGIVTNRKQAIAIAMSEAGKSRESRALDGASKKRRTKRRKL